ncbi:hypothetical protein BegalDRAFT_1268 [Beggiatoa alba B18LD]|uniref:Argininosuccinate lyase n=1 Tax=Beggiatoa alba B18LD TaxID=395493 RepID=I3CEX2_9GAMM|nr:hypothetical protein [Beggiatoa alba]EIJ42165.1 hypothetical protein BegalDRAFT_1268 [Beggiatoa alba B18LD]
MRTQNLFALLCALPIVFFAQFAAAEDDYTITNDAGVVIDELYLAASETTEWGPDILGQDTLAEGATASIIFDHDDDRCLWDLGIKDANGNKIAWQKLDLCKYTKITLKPEGVANLE